MGGGSGGGGRGASLSSSSSSSSSSDPNATPATHKVDVRLVVPALRTLDALLACGALDGAEGEGGSWALPLAELVRKRLLTGKEDVPRVLATSAVMLGLLHFRAARDLAFVTVLDILAHPFPLLRRSTAEKLYVKLLGDGGAGGAGVPQATFDAALAVLSETNWGGGLEEARGARDSLYALLGVAMPEVRMGCSEEDVALAERGGGGGSSAEDQGTAAGYGALAAEAGY